MASNGPPFKKRKIIAPNGEEREVHYFTGPDPLNEQQQYHTPVDWNQMGTVPVVVEKQEGAYMPSWCGSLQEQMQKFVHDMQQKQQIPREVKPERQAFAINGGSAALSSFLADNLPSFLAPNPPPTVTDVNSNKRKRSFSVFDQPLSVVQPQRKYLRNQLHLSLIGSTLAEADFSDNEGTVTLYKLINHVNEDEHMPMMGQWRTVLKPIATLYAPHVSKIFGDDKFLYSVTGGEDLWLTWWDIGKHYEMQQLNLTHKLIPLVRPSNFLNTFPKIVDLIVFCF